jgi:hypothetical protein
MLSRLPRVELGVEGIRTVWNQCVWPLQEYSASALSSRVKWRIDAKHSHHCNASTSRDVLCEILFSYSFFQDVPQVFNRNVSEAPVRFRFRAWVFARLRSGTSSASSFGRLTAWDERSAIGTRHRDIASLVSAI